MSTLRLAISTQSSPLLSLPKWRQVSEIARIDAIDLDIANPVRKRLTLRGLDLGSLTSQYMPSVWIGPNVPDRLASLISSDGLAIVSQVSLQHGRKSQTIDPAPLNDIRSRLPGTVRLAVALSPINHEGTRTHLDRISAIRHVAEEWDFDLALDLTGPIDPRWEAEAAVLRLGERLQLVRFTAPTFDQGPFWQESNHLRHVMVARVLSALADFGFQTTLSFKVHLPFWRWSNVGTIADDLSLAVATTLAKFQSKPSSIITPHKRVG